MGLVLAALAVKLLDESVVVAAARLCGAACAAVTCGTALKLVPCGAVGLTGVLSGVGAGSKSAAPPAGRAPAFTAIGEVETALAVSRTADVDSLCNTVDDAGVAATGGVLELIR